MKPVRTGAISGRVVDADATRLPIGAFNYLGSKGIAKALLWPRAPTIAGNIGSWAFRLASYRLLAAANSATPGQLSLKLTGAEEYSCSWTYYPGTSDARRPSTIDVGPGAELLGFDLALVRSRVVRISGRHRPGGCARVLGRPGKLRCEAPGDTFELRGVEPGTYLLSAIGR